MLSIRLKVLRISHWSWWRCCERSLVDDPQMLDILKANLNQSGYLLVHSY